LRPNCALLHLGGHPERVCSGNPPADSENLTNAPRYVECKLISIRKSYTGFRLVVPKGVTLNDFELNNGRYFAAFRPKRQLSEPTATMLNELKLDSYCLRQKCTPKDSSFRLYMTYDRGRALLSKFFSVNRPTQTFSLLKMCNTARRYEQQLSSYFSRHTTASY